MDRTTFAANFDRAAAQARDCARSYIKEALPDALRFRLRLNASYDGNPLHEDERVFPGDGDDALAAALSDVGREGALAALHRDGRIPEWIDLSVVGRSEEATLIEALCCGRFTDNDALLYHAEEGHAPFHVLGPALPPGWQEGQRFSIYHRSEARDPGELQLLAPFAAEIWSLDLRGAAFDDEALGALPALPALEILALPGSPLRGPGLAALARAPRLRVLRIALAAGAELSLAALPRAAALDTLLLEDLPAAPLSLEPLRAAAPRLDSLELAGGDLDLRGRLPEPLGELTLRGERVRGAPALPRRLRALGLHLRSAEAAALRDLVRGVEEVRALHLRGTPVGEDLLGEWLRRWPLGRLDVVDTGLPEEALRRLVALRPGLRTRPRLGAAGTP